MCLLKEAAEHYVAASAKVEVHLSKNTEKLR